MKNEKVGVSVCKNEEQNKRANNKTKVKPQNL